MYTHIEILPVLVCDGSSKFVSLKHFNYEIRIALNLLVLFSFTRHFFCIPCSSTRGDISSEMVCKLPRYLKSLTSSSGSPSTRVPVTIEGEPLEEFKDFKYLGSYISSDSNIDKEVSTRIGLAAQAFKKLNNIWKSRTLSTKTKLRIYQSNVRSTLPYASETWRTNKTLESKLRGFEGRCLRRILKVRWQEKVCNEEIWRRTGMNNIVLEEVKRRRWTWLGHVLRMKKGRHPLEALSWAPPGKRHRGRPLGTWRRTIEDEMETAGKTWNELRWLAQDRSEWKKFVGALCSPQRGSED